MNRIAAFILFSASLMLTAPAHAIMLYSATFYSTLSGANSVPAVPSSAIGTAVLTYYFGTNTFDLSAEVSGITTSNLTGSHIHLGATGVNGPIIVPIATSLWTNNGAGGMTLALTGQAFPAINETDLLAGNTYLNIHTTAYPGGEIRGQIASPVPLPAAAWLLGSGLLGFIAVSRKHKSAS